MDEKRDMDIIKNVRTIEWIKSELLTSVAYLYEAMIKGEDDNKVELENTVSNIILLSFILSKRLGLNYEGVLRSLENNIKLNIAQGHKIEQWYGDLTELLDFVQEK